MQIRKSTKDDIKDILSVIDMAKKYLKSQNIDQWQNAYPNEEVILNDISLDNSYVVLIDNKVVATFFISFDIEPTYNYIDGNWLSDDVYSVIHRIAVDDTYKRNGVAKFILDFCADLSIKNNIHSIKIDTHSLNNAMRKFLEKNDFKECGTIYLEDGSLRVAYEKLI